MHKLTQRVYRLFSIAVITLLVSSCSTKLAYGYLDWAMMWYVERYIDLNATQKSVAKKDFDAFHDWHRTTELPRYSKFLKSLKVILLASPSGDTLHKQTDIMQDFIDDSTLYLLPTLSKLVPTLSDKQVAQFLKKIDKNNKKFEKKNVNISESKLYKKREKDLTKHLSRLVGKLTKSQKLLVKTWARKVVPFEALMLKQQYIWRDDYEKILDNRTNKEATSAAIKSIMLYRSDDWITELQTQVDINQTLTFELFENIFASLSDKQKRKLEWTIDKYIKICDDLSRST